MMSNSEIMQKLMDEMSNDHAWYLGYIGILVGLVVAFVGLIGYLQLRLSDKQINKIKDDIRNDIHEEYPIDEFKKIKEMEKAFTGVSQSRLLQFQQTLLDADNQNITSIYETTQLFVEELMVIEVVSLPDEDLQLIFMDFKQLVSYAATANQAVNISERHAIQLLNNLFVSLHERFKKVYKDRGYDGSDSLYQMIEERIGEFQTKQHIHVSEE